MTVSKFLHFYNPALFPIYDYEVMWKKVCNGRFKNDFREFCCHERIPNNVVGDNAEDTAAFLRYYMIWASSLLSVAHTSFMQVFRDWLAKQSGTELLRGSLTLQRFMPEPSSTLRSTQQIYPGSGSKP